MIPHIDKRLIQLISLLLLTLLGQACARNTITSSWVDQSFKGPIKGRIIVVGVFQDPTTHKIFEDSFVISLTKAGVDAVPSYKYSQGEKRHSKEWLKQIVKDSGASTILITHLSNEKKMTEDIPPHGLILGGEMYGNGVDGYQSFVLEKTLEPGYILTRTDDFIDATLFDCQSNKPIWASKSKSVNLNHFLRTDDEQLDDLYIFDMKRNHLL